MSDSEYDFDVAIPKLKASGAALKKSAEIDVMRKIPVGGSKFFIEGKTGWASAVATRLTRDIGDGRIYKTRTVEEHGEKGARVWRLK